MADILGGALHQEDIGDRLPSVHVEGGARQGGDDEGKGDINIHCLKGLKLNLVQNLSAFSLVMSVGSRLTLSAEVEIL